MEKILDKCLKCYNSCKLKSETNAVLISCPKYLSKRSRTLEKERDKGNIPSESERSLNQMSVFEIN